MTKLAVPNRPVATSKVTILALLVAVATSVAWIKILREEIAKHTPYSAAAIIDTDALRKKFGPTKYSRNAEEWIIRDYFSDRRDGVFLDVGANHYRDENNTYFLETELGWSGIAVDAMEEFGPDYKTHRPRTRYVAMFASDVA